MLIPCDKIWTLIFALFLHIVLSTFYSSQNYLVILSSYALVFLFLRFSSWVSAETLFSSLHNLFLKFYSNFTSSVTPSPTIPFLCDFLFPEFQIIVSHLSVVRTLHGDCLLYTLHILLCMWASKFWVWFSCLFSHIKHSCENRNHPFYYVAPFGSMHIIIGTIWIVFTMRRHYFRVLHVLIYLILIRTLWRRYSSPLSIYDETNLQRDELPEVTIK